MTIKNHIKKEIDKTKVEKEMLHTKGGLHISERYVNNDANSTHHHSNKSKKQIGEKVTLILVFVLLVISIIQSVELFNLRSQIMKGLFTSGTPNSTTSTNQGLPSQQGGC